MKKQFIAHRRKKDKKIQSLWEHLCETSEFSGQFADKIGLKELGKILGLLHDLGKASQEFQNYICSATGLINPDEDDWVDVAAKKGKVDHSSAGAQFIYRYFSGKGTEGLCVAQALSLCVASHHTGLMDCLLPTGENNFKTRMEKQEEKSHTNEAISNFEGVEYEKLIALLSKEVEKNFLAKMNGLKENNDSKDTIIFKFGLLIRFLFSCLIDADRLSTADFESPNNTWIRNYGQYHPWEELILRLNHKIKEFEDKIEKK